MRLVLRCCHSISDPHVTVAPDAPSIELPITPTDFAQRDGRTSSRPMLIPPIYDIQERKKSRICPAEIGCGRGAPSNLDLIWSADAMTNLRPVWLGCIRVILA